MNHMATNESIIVMSLSMILAGIFSGMNAFVNKPQDIRLNINDFYMSLMMIGLMFVFMSVYYKSLKLFIFGGIVSIITFVMIRRQMFVNKRRYIESMIPHHSMAVMMSKELLKKNEDLTGELRGFVENIITTQEKEIEFMEKN